MYEFELKVRADHEAVTELLADRGGTHQQTVTQKDTYYNAPDRDFAETDEALRIRRETTGQSEPTDGTTQAKVTYKGPLVHDESKTREEAETRIEDREAMHAILTGLGYEPAATVEKERAQYTFRDWTVTLDAVDGLGEFVEIERETERELESDEQANELARLREEAGDVLEELGLDADEQIQTSYLGLLLESDQ